MMFELRKHPEFDRKLDEQVAWLKQRTLWVAPRFADAVGKAFELIRQRPAAGRPVWKEFRCYNIPGFSRSLICRMEADCVYLIALMHERRHPDYWKERIN